jgi:hypothetical protein
MAKASQAERLADLFGDADPFRFVIRGHALIDERLDELLECALLARRRPSCAARAFSERSTFASRSG